MKNLMGKRHSGDAGIDRRMILKYGVRIWTVFSWHKIGSRGPLNTLMKRTLILRIA
jgi:hypothetical protein